MRQRVRLVGSDCSRMSHSILLELGSTGGDGVKTVRNMDRVLGGIWETEKVTFRPTMDHLLGGVGGKGEVRFCGRPVGASGENDIPQTTTRSPTPPCLMI